MRRRIVGLMLAIAMLGGASGAVAMRGCRQLCRDEVGTCVTDAKAQIVCDGLHGHDRRDCRRALRRAVRTCKSTRGPILSTCRASAGVNVCASPAGAFVATPSGS